MIAVNVVLETPRAVLYGLYWGRQSALQQTRSAAHRAMESRDTLTFIILHLSLTPHICQSVRLAILLAI